MKMLRPLTAAALAFAAPALASENRLRDVVVTFDRAEPEDAEYTRAYFDVENRGDRELKEVHVECEFLDANNRRLDYGYGTAYGVRKGGYHTISALGRTDGRYSRAKCRPTQAK